MINNTVTHTVNGMEYEIRSIHTIENLVAASFRSGKLLSRYAITRETFNDYNEQHASDTVPAPAAEMLINFAKGDLDDGIVS